MKYLLILLFLFSISSAWALQECEGSPMIAEVIPYDWNNCHGYITISYKLREGNIYEGDFENGKIVKGVKVFSRGTDNFHVYIGEFKDNNPWGKGIQYSEHGYAEGEFEGGSFINGKSYTNNGNVNTFTAGKISQDFNPEVANIFLEKRDAIYKEYRIIHSKYWNRHNNKTEKNSDDSINSAKLECKEIGFKEGTEAFGECVLDLTE